MEEQLKKAEAEPSQPVEPTLAVEPPLASAPVDVAVEKKADVVPPSDVDAKGGDDTKALTVVDSKWSLCVSLYLSQWTVKS